MSTLFDENKTIHPLPHKKIKKGLGIAGRLMIGFTSITFFFLIALGINWAAITIAKNYSNQVIKIDLPAYDTFLDLNSNIFLSQFILQKIVFTNDQALKNNFNKIWTKIEESVSELNQFSNAWSNSQYLKQWSELKALIDNLKNEQFKWLNTTTKDTANLLQQINSDTIPLLLQISQLLNVQNSNNMNLENLGLLDWQSQKLNKGTANVVESLDMAQWTEYLLSILGVIAAVIIALVTARSIVRHINIFRQHSSRIASGDLTRSIEIERDDEMGLLGNDLNVMTNSLASIAKELTQSCHDMVTTLAEVRHAVDMQSSGASEQASSINEITASLSEIEKSSAQTMDKAKSLGEAAERTREKGHLGLEAVEKSTNSMKEIREKVQMIAQTILDLSHQTQKVGEITSVVNNLAQQSKMLALNASIEAAKAGEAGKGFSIVAAEVKNLAEQSEQATTQVQKILENIRQSAEKAVMVTEEGTKGVDNGKTLVEQTGEIIRNLNDVIYETTIASQQIESAVRQEGAGIEQITAGMNEINQVTHSFVDSVKQTTEAMSNLTIIAKNLQSYVDRYKL